MLDDADQHRNKRQKVEPHENGDNGEVPVNTSLLATNHERQSESKQEEGQSPAMADIEMGGDQQETRNAEDASLERLEEDMGDAFLLCRSSKTLRPSQLIVQCC